MTQRWAYNIVNRCLHHFLAVCLTAFRFKIWILDLHNQTLSKNLKSCDLVWEGNFPCAKDVARWYHCALCLYLKCPRFQAIQSSISLSSHWRWTAMCLVSWFSLSWSEKLKFLSQQMYPGKVQGVVWSCKEENCFPDDGCVIGYEVAMINFTSWSSKLPEADRLSVSFFFFFFHLRGSFFFEIWSSSLHSSGLLSTFQNTCVTYCVDKYLKMTQRISQRLQEHQQLQAETAGVQGPS